MIAIAINPVSCVLKWMFFYFSLFFLSLYVCFKFINIENNVFDWLKWVKHILEIFQNKGATSYSSWQNVTPFTLHALLDYFQMNYEYLLCFKLTRVVLGDGSKKGKKYSWLRFNSVVVQDWYQSVPVRSTPTPDPYPHSNGGQTFGTHWSCPTHPLHISLVTCGAWIYKKTGLSGWEILNQDN